MKTFDLQTEADYEAEIKQISNECSQDKIKNLNTLLAKIKDNRKQANKIYTEKAIGRALLKKHIYYKNNAFYGHFSIEATNELLKLGATWNKKKRCYNLNYNRIPKDIITIISILDLQTIQLKNLFNEIMAVKKTKTKTTTTTFQKTKTPKAVSTMLFSTIGFIKNQLNKNAINKKTNKVVNDLTKEAKERIIKSLEGKTTDEEKQEQSKYEKEVEDKIKKSVETLEYNIKDSNYENTKRMREKFFEALQLNKTNSELENIVKDHIQGTQKRVEFIVKQETRLLLTEYQTEQMKKNKQTKFKWVHRVPYGQNDRDVHIKWFEESNKGRVFDLNKLPINPTTGKQDKPGQDFHCHCKMRMIIE